MGVELDYYAKLNPKRQQAAGNKKHFNLTHTAKGSNKQQQKKQQKKINILLKRGRRRRSLKPTRSPAPALPFLLHIWPAETETVWQLSEPKKSLGNRSERRRARERERDSRELGLKRFALVRIMT